MPSYQLNLFAAKLPAVLGSTGNIERKIDHNRAFEMSSRHPPSLMLLCGVKLTCRLTAPP